MKKVYDVLKAIADKLAEIYLIIATVFFCVLIFSSFMQVFTRYVLNSSWPWTEELSRYCFIWMIILGAACGLHRSKLVAVTIIPDKLKGNAKRFLQGLISLLLLVCSMVLLITGIQMVKTVGNVPSVIMRLPMGFVHAALPVGGFLMSLASLVGVLKAIGGYEDETPKKAESEEEFE